MSRVESLSVPGAVTLVVVMPKAPGAPGGTKHGNKQVVSPPLFYRLPCRDTSEQHWIKANSTTKGETEARSFSWG